MRVFVSIEEFDQQQLSRLQDLVGGSMVQRQNYSDNAPLESDFQGCDIVFGNVPANWLEQNQNIRWMQLDSVGFGEYRALDWHSMGKRLTVTNLAGFFADQVAESILAGILALHRGIDKLVQLRDKRQWIGDPLRSELHCLSNSRVVLFGCGSINQRVESLLDAFGCTTTSFGRNWNQHTLDTALADAQILISVVPETDLTIGVFDRHRLGLLGPSGLFVNAGRGSAVDEDALVDMLISGALGGAVVDVTIDEPLNTDHPLWSTPNTILTQHTGGGTADELDRKIDVFADNLARLQAGKPFSNIVDFDRGY